MFSKQCLRPPATIPVTKATPTTTVPPAQATPTTAPVAQATPTIVPMAPSAPNESGVPGARVAMGIEYQQNPAYLTSHLKCQLNSILQQQITATKQSGDSLELTYETIPSKTTEAYECHYYGRPKSCDNKGEGSVGGACRKACVVLVVMVLCVMLVAALAAGVLALTIIFTGFIDICKCGTTNASAVLGENESSLLMKVQVLEVIVQELRQKVTTAATPTTTTPTFPGIKSSPGATPPSTLHLREVNFFQGCTTRVEETCTISVGDGTGFCITQPFTPVNIPGEIILNLNCLRTMETDEPNPLIATLDIFEGTAACICAVPDLEVTGRRQFDVECGLQVTRCITPQNITVMITN